MISKVAKSGIIAGGLLGGGIGAAIGGLSASSTQTEMVKSITLKITVENLKILYTISTSSLLVRMMDMNLKVIKKTEI